MISEEFAAHLGDIFQAAHRHGDRRLSKWEQDFAADLAQRFEDYGLRFNVSPKQWEILSRIRDKLGVDKEGGPDEAVEG